MEGAGMEIIFSEMSAYLAKLDWWYILSFTLISYFLANDGSITKWWKEGKSMVANKVRCIMLAIPKGLRVLCLGLIYGVIFYVWRGKDHEHGSDSFTLFQSFLFAVALHGILIKSVTKWFKSMFKSQIKETDRGEGEL